MLIKLPSLYSGATECIFSSSTAIKLTNTQDRKEGRKLVNIFPPVQFHASGILKYFHLQGDAKEKLNFALPRFDLWRENSFPSIVNMSNQDHLAPFPSSSMQGAKVLMSCRNT